MLEEIQFFQSSQTENSSHNLDGGRTGQLCNPAQSPLTASPIGVRSGRYAIVSYRDESTTFELYEQMFPFLEMGTVNSNEGATDKRKKGSKSAQTHATRQRARRLVTITLCPLK